MSDTGTKGLEENTPINAPYILVMKNGREHSFFLETFTDDGWLVGKVSIGMTLSLSSAGPGPLRLSVDRDNDAEQKLADREVYVRGRCVVRSPIQNVRFPISEVSVMEDSSRPLVRLNEDGTLDNSSAEEVFPELSSYKTDTGDYFNPFASAEALEAPATLELLSSPETLEAEGDGNQGKGE